MEMHPLFKTPALSRQHIPAPHSHHHALVAPSPGYYRCEGHTALMCIKESNTAQTNNAPSSRPPVLPYRCPVHLSNSQDGSLIQRVLITLVLRLIMNDGFSFDSSIACSEFFRVS